MLNLNFLLDFNIIYQPIYWLILWYYKEIYLCNNINIEDEISLIAKKNLTDKNVLITTVISLKTIMIEFILLELTCLGIISSYLFTIISNFWNLNSNLNMTLKYNKTTSRWKEMDCGVVKVNKYIIAFKLFANVRVSTLNLSQFG